MDLNRFGETRFNSESTAYDPALQLLIIMPKELKFLVPKKFHSVFYKLKRLYPDPFDYDIDLLYKTKHWQGIPILPELDPDKIKKEYDLRKDEGN